MIIGETWITVRNVTLEFLKTCIKYKSLYSQLTDDVPEVVAATKKQVGASEESRSNFSKTAVTTRTPQAVLVPAAVESSK